MKKPTLILAAVFAYSLLPFAYSFSQGTAINSTGAKADSSAILDVSSTAKGMLIPRMSKAEKLAISSPATGLLIYQTDDTTGFWYYNGSKWMQSLQSSSSSGNSKFGGTGADGALNISSGTTTLNLGGLAYYMKNYTSVNISGTGKLAFSNPNANGTVVILKSQGNVTITSTAVPSIDLRGIGGEAGAGGSNGVVGGQGKIGTGAVTSSAPSGAGGGGNCGGGGSASTAYIATYFSSPIFATKSIRIACGSGGGGGTSGYTGGGSCATSYGGNGGRGGGAIYIECGQYLNFTGSVYSDGNNGSNGQNGGCSPPPCGGGGGGGAGSVVIVYNNLTSNTGTVSSKGGNGGSAGTGTCGTTTCCSGGGGGGGASFYGTGGAGQGSCGSAGGAGAGGGGGGGGGNGASGTGCNGAAGGSGGVTGGAVIIQNTEF